MLKRNYSNEDVLRAVLEAKRCGLQVGMYNLIGIPGETRKDFKETVRMNRLCQPDWYLLSVYFPYPGTDLYRTCEEQGLLKEVPDTDLERRRPALKLPGFPKRAIRRNLTWFAFNVYRGHKPLMAILMVVLRSWIFSHRRALDLYRKLARRFAK